MTHSASDSAVRGEPPALLLVETHSPAEATGSEFIRLARTLLNSGAVVQLHLMQNGVTWLQQDPQTLRNLVGESGGRLRLTMDDISLDLRGIPHASAAGVAAVRSAMALVSDMAQPRVKTLWHS
jgi:hypothetical protein